MSNKKHKIAIVSPRYGTDVTGGAELLARLLAEHLNKYYEITVITTKAQDYLTWQDYYTTDEDCINEVDVLRFSVDKPRTVKETQEATDLVFANRDHTLQDEEYWQKTQGPYSSSLLKYLKKNKNKYDLFIFVPYLYATTYFGIQTVKDKAVLIPAAHDEPTLYINLFESMFDSVKGIIASTIEELRLIHNTFPSTKGIPSLISAIGIEAVPEITENETLKIKKKFNLNKPFMLFLGRVEPGKGSIELFNYFLRYKKETNNNIQLVLAGKEVTAIPDHPDIKFLGFVSVKEKFTLLKLCNFLINPSPFESLSLIVLEAWKMKKPVLVSAKCEVLKGQCSRANAGLWYENYQEFKVMINWLLTNKTKVIRMGKNGSQYVHSNYEWPIIERKITRFLNRLLKNNG